MSGRPFTAPTMARESPACRAQGATLKKGHGCGGLAKSNVQLSQRHKPVRRNAHFQNPCLFMAFENAHFEVLAYAAEQKVNVKLSGTTAVVALAKGGTVYLAHAGNSCAVVGAVHGKQHIAATKDHSPAEVARVGGCGREPPTRATKSTEWSMRLWMRSRGRAGHGRLGRIPGSIHLQSAASKSCLGRDVCQLPAAGVPEALASAKICEVAIRRHGTKKGVEFFLAPFFFFLGARFFFVGGWCRLELCHFCKLWQEKTRISAEFRVLQPNTPFGA